MPLESVLSLPVYVTIIGVLFFSLASVYTMGKAFVYAHLLVFLNGTLAVIRDSKRITRWILVVLFNLLGHIVFLLLFVSCPVDP